MPRSVVVVHREAMVAEGLAAALARYSQIVPIGVATSAAEAERRAEGAHAVAIDQRLPGAEATAGNLRGRGVQVVFLWDGESTNDGGGVSTRDSVSVLARALAPFVDDLDADPKTLTTRERQILAFVSRGLAAKQIAQRLGISAKTVEHHKPRIC